MLQYTKKCSTRQKRRARRQNCKVERSATNSFTPEGDHQAGQEGRYENTTYIYISSYRARCQRIRQCRCACMLRSTLQFCLLALRFCRVEHFLVYWNICCVYIYIYIYIYIYMAESSQLTSQKKQI